MIAASGALVLVGGLGAVAGPVMIASIMDYFGDQYLFWSMAAAHMLIGLFGLVRMVARAPIPLDKQGKSTSAAVHPSGAAIEYIQQYASSEADEDDEDDNWD